MTTDKGTKPLALEPTPANIEAQRRRFHELGDQIYVRGVKTRAHRDALVGERKRIREWLAENDPDSADIRLPQTDTTYLTPCAECGQPTTDPHPRSPGRPLCPLCQAAEDKARAEAAQQANKSP